MARVVKIIPITRFKELLGTSTLNIYQSADGQRYYATSDQGVRVAAVAHDAIDAPELVALELTDGVDSWYLIVPRKETPNPIRTI